MKHARDDYNRIQDPEGKIGEDEPVFLLRAKDILAPRIVLAWANTLEAEMGDPKMVTLARKHAKYMEDWQQRNGCKLPDM